MAGDTPLVPWRPGVSLEPGVQGAHVTELPPDAVSTAPQTLAPGQVLQRAPSLPGAVLFVCTMNVLRSPMAAGILRHLAAKRCYVESAGVRAGEPDAFVIAIMDEIGIDLRGHRPHTLADLQDTTFDLIVSLSPEAHHQALELTRTMAVEVEYWPMFDASLMVGQGSREQVLGSYRQVRELLFKRIKTRFGLEGGPTV